MAHRDAPLGAKANAEPTTGIPANIEGESWVPMAKPKQLRWTKTSLHRHHPQALEKIERLTPEAEALTSRLALVALTRTKATIQKMLTIGATLT